MIPSHLMPNFTPKPNPKAVVEVPNLRVTVLTTRLLRIEYSPANQFEDRASQPFWFRDQPIPEYTWVTLDNNDLPGEILELSTPDLKLKYRVGQPFSPDTLTIQVKSIGHTWRFGEKNPGNLKGTYRTLDNRSGQVPLEPGLLSRDGWTLIDDSHTLVFNEQGWLEVRNALPGTLDLYFFGYGLDYQDCLRDYRALTGPVPLLPRWVLGNWWSRFWEYNQSQVIALIQEFQDHEVPLSVFIIDMDWHITKTGNKSTGWTGYTWNRDLFPDPPTLIRHIHERGIKTAVNLHPAEGIHPHEEQYQDFARFMDLDPASQEPIPFDLANPKFTRAYFDLLHHPQEADGLDFWWIDWQQGTLSTMPGLDPLWWLNHLHFLDFGRPRSKGSKAPGRRPFIFSRWGGLGNHRYPIGFSGDTVVSWNSLAYQPYFTATAANVCYGWWSHDIGGHMSGIEDPELYTRWVQYGLFSPIFRLHSTKNPYHERRPFAYDAEISRLTCHAMRMRHSFIPYLYTMAWRDHQEAITPIRPLYHLEPSSEPAYYAPDTYTFGSELVAAPFTCPMDSDTRLSRQKIWLPEGDWFNFFTGELFPAGHHVVYGDLSEIPLYAKSGAIVPLAPLPTWGGTENPTHLRIHIFPGEDNQLELYDDDGNTTAYLDGEYTLTPFELTCEDDCIRFTIGRVKGSRVKFVKIRTYELKFWGITEPNNCQLKINDLPCLVFPEYDSKTQSLKVPVDVDILPTDKVELTLSKDDGSIQLEKDLSQATLVTCKQLLDHFRLETLTKSGIVEYLPEIIKNPELLARPRPTLTDSHLQALLETITRSGVHRLTHSGDDNIILWNENPIQDTFPVTYHLAVNQLFWGYYDHGYHYESGPVPKFKVFHPPTQFGENAWELRVKYGNVLTIRLASQP
jgi:alpha-glucosidase (family GH31 glycosyl hydrolase)